MTKGLRVWWISNPPREAFEFPVSSPEEAIRILDALAYYDLHLGDLVFANLGGLLNEDGEEWESDQGEDIHEYRERLTDHELERI